MKLSVVILNYNVRYFLELCLQSVEAAIENLDAEIIVVDNNSPDDSCVMVKTKFPNVKLIENKENLGFSKGNNIGVNQAIGEYICILNPDTVVPENGFLTLIKFADLKVNLGILGCQLIDGIGQFLPESKRDIPTPKVAFKKILGNTKSYYSKLERNTTGKVEILVGAFMLLKKELYYEVDGFDEDYFMYGEDIDLSYKILKKGYENYYCSEVKVIHFKGESTIRNNVYAKRFYGAMQLFYKKHFRVNVFLDLLAYVCIKFASILNSNIIKAKIYRNIAGTCVVSKRSIESLKQKLVEPIYQYEDIQAFREDVIVVLDAELMSYSNIINIIMANGQKGKRKFRIWPKKCNFILGSDSSLNRGKVIKF